MVYVPFGASVQAAEGLGVVIGCATNAPDTGQVSVERLHVALSFGCFQRIHACVDLRWLELHRPELREGCWCQLFPGDLGGQSYALPSLIGAHVHGSSSGAVIITRTPQTDVSDEGLVCQPGIWRHLREHHMLV